MIGTNRLFLNQATMCQAVEDYLNAQRTEENLKVVSVIQPGTDEFVVVVKVEETDGSETK